MQMHNDREATHGERTEYMGSSHYYEPFSNQTFQQQAAYPPLASYSPSSYSHKPFTGVPPLSDSRFAALLSYSGGWLTGLLFIFLGGRDRFIRFHALQSLVFFGAINLISFGLFVSILSFVHHARFLMITLHPCVSLLELHRLCMLDRCHGSGCSWCVLQIALCG